ncbi:MAG: DNA replication protein DnaC [Ruminococcaceae bacterium]|nr:DNA replication protein DnaC [Oscillospiraceae bacterium]
MAYSAEVVRRAKARLAQAKADRESENLQHLQQAYEALPRLRQIDQQLRLTMAKAAQAAFTTGGDVHAIMDQIKNENLALQQERTRLVSANFEEGFLDDSPICPHCGGTGYMGSAMCECLMELCRQEQKKELTLLSGGKENFAQFRLDYYPEQVDSRYGASPRAIMERNFQTCRRYATTFTENSGNLLFVGSTGLGKTFLSACIARAVADRGYSVLYETASHLFSKLERAKFGGSEEDRQAADKLMACDLLIIDDLGTEMPGQFVTAALYNLVNDRLLSGKPMVISTNLNIDELSRRYSPQIASRLHGNFARLTFVGDDIRVMKNRGI